MSSATKKKSKKKAAERIPPTKPAARDEGPRLIPLPEEARGYKFREDE